MAVALPPELLTMILNELINDTAALHSCILINRNWYRASIQYLWAKPFTLLYTCLKSENSRYKTETLKLISRQRAENLMKTFIECFTNVDDIKEELEILEKKSNKEASFDYSRYLREIHFNEVWKLVVYWLNLDLSYGRYSCDTKDNMNRTERLTVRIISFAIQYCQQLRILSLTPWNVLSYQQLSRFIVPTKELLQLKSFTWESKRSHRRVFGALSRVAHNLESLSVDFYYRKYHLKKKSRDSFQRLVQVQHKLKSITIKSLYTDMGSIMELMRLQSASLKSIKFACVNFGSTCSSFEAAKLNKLKDLELLYCTIMTTHGIKPFIMADLPSLQQLTVKNTPISDEIWELILHKHGKTLIEISIEKQKLSDSVLRVMSQTCNSLSHLSIDVYKELSISLAFMVANLPNLHSLLVRYSSPLRESYSDGLFNALSKHSIPHLYYLELCNTGNFEVDSLENFLSKSRPSLRSLIIDDSSEITEAHFNVILYHLSDTLKTLRVKYDIGLVSRDCIHKLRSIIDNFVRDGEYISDASMFDNIYVYPRTVDFFEYDFSEFITYEDDVFTLDVSTPSMNTNVDVVSNDLDEYIAQDTYVGRFDYSDIFAEYTAYNVYNSL
ncbi:10966_t:CDS:1 [Paraglomus occultum]|uniref:10966_t:CDS:1 n=1 Tax=Paraglomus occultum TaxID=144539 RepID=A0A9N9A5F7_9GLOM|nr:10966_t:CDS:1 [Paraglomus occultum]